MKDERKKKGERENNNNNKKSNKRIRTGDYVSLVYKLDAKKYQCGPCGKDFVRKDSLKQHCKSKKHLKPVGNCMDSPLDAISLDNEDTGVNSDAVALEGENQDVDCISSDSDASFDNNTDLDGEDDGVVFKDSNGDLLERFTSRFNMMEETMEEGDNNLDSLAYADMMAIPGALPTFPFPNIQTMVLHAFVHGDDDPVSRRMLKKVLYLLEVILQLKVDSLSSSTPFELPKLDALINYSDRKNNDVPQFKTSSATVEKHQRKVNATASSDTIATT
ncbi:hypothetical protein [Absidia glauca]|uniref:C2H2-type domain-containing protein n=1 Tax=Absidia glauca TaxID=4829 RepID=A0A168L8B0_ABSGL|nr:hypothetical protein [Absidia glauca]